MGRYSKLVIVDGFWQDTRELDLDRLRSIVPDVEFHEGTMPSQVVERTASAELVITNKVRFMADELSRLPRLKYIGVAATGFNVVDIVEAARRGIVVTNVPAYSTDSVAQTVFAFILEHSMHIAAPSEAVHSGRWTSCPNFSFTVAPLHELVGKTMGIIGLGRIGMKVAEIANAFGMNVVAHSRTLKPQAPSFIMQTTLETVFKQADFLSLHCPLTSETHHLVNSQTIALMKPTAFLVNTSRGPVVDEQALADALNSNRIAGAAADTLSSEPPSANNPLLTARNCLISPHLAWATTESKARLVNVIIDNVRAFVNGHPVNQVN